jgi:hypothetical protein
MEPATACPGNARMAKAELAMNASFAGRNNIAGKSCPLFQSLTKS